MSYFPQYPQDSRPDNGHHDGAVPASILIIRILMPGQVPHLRATTMMGKDILLILVCLRLRPFKLLIDWRKTWNVSSVNSSD